MSAPLLAHWPLAGHARDLAGAHHGTAQGVTWTDGPDGRANGAALFDGREAVITVPDAPTLQLAGAPFTVSGWFRCPGPMRGAWGDLLSKFDAERRCGLNLWLGGSSGSYCSFGDNRHLHAGIDDGYLGAWRDHGHPGVGNPLVTLLAVHEGQLYAGMADSPQPGEACKVYRWLGGKRWEDCGRLGNDPDHLSVMSMISHGGHLYAGTGIWDWARAEEARQAQPPRALTRVFRYEGGREWRDLGQVGQGHRVLCMASFEGELFVGLDRGGGGGCYRLRGDRWEDAGNTEERDNFECLMPVGGVLYGASHFALYRWEGGTSWRCIGRKVDGATQIHAFQQMGGRLWVGTWPQGYILRHEGGDSWTNTGIVGLATNQPGVAQINEINALGVHNGKLYTGVLPKAQVYRYDADGHWTLLDNLATRRDWNPHACPTWSRVLTLTTHRGRLFAATGACQARHWDLDPDENEGRVYSRQAGLAVSHEREIGGGWTHFAFVRGHDDLRLYLNGRQVQREKVPRGRYFDLGNACPLTLGRGAQGTLWGALADFRLHGGALPAGEIASLARRAN